MFLPVCVVTRGLGVCSGWQTWRRGAGFFCVAQAGRGRSAAAGCPVGCLSSYKHAVDVRRGKGGARDVGNGWTLTVLSCKETNQDANYRPVRFSWTFRCHGDSLLSDSLAEHARVLSYLMDQRKRKKRKVGCHSCRQHCYFISMD